MGVEGLLLLTNSAPGENAAMSTLVLFTTGALPYMKPGETISNTDIGIIQNIAVNIKNGNRTQAKTGREAIIDF